jgi:hypothetical protein
MKSEFSRQIFKKYSDVKFYENPVGVEFTRADRQAGMTKPIVAFSQICERA